MHGDRAGAVQLLETRPIGLPIVPSVFDGGRPAVPRSLREVLEATVAAFPNASAIEDDRGVLDYRGLLTEVDRLVARLGRCRIGLGDRVGVRVPSGTADLYLAILAVLSAGAAYVPVDADDPDDRAEMVFAEAGVCAVIGANGMVTARPGSSPPPRGIGPRRPRPGDDAWIIFTSGSTGKPK